MFAGGAGEILEKAEISHRIVCLKSVEPNRCVRVLVK